VAAEVLGRLDEGLPRAPTRSWIADDEVAELARTVIRNPEDDYGAGSLKR